MVPGFDGDLQYAMVDPAREAQWSLATGAGFDVFSGGCGAYHCLAVPRTDAAVWLALA
jgi:hypothetical protein